MSDLTKVIHSTSLPELGANLSKAFGDLLNILDVTDDERTEIQNAISQAEALTSTIESELQSLIGTAVANETSALVARVTALETEVAAKVAAAV